LRDAPDLPLFMQPWYLDAVCQEGHWDAAVAEKDGFTAAVLPFFLKKKWGWRYVAMPPLGKFHGPYLLPEYRNLNDEHRLYAALIDQLPQGLAAYSQDFHYTVTNWLPFYWLGYRQTTRYSYVLDLGLSEADLFRRIDKSYRQKIAKAQNLVQVTAERPLTDLYGLLRKSFDRQDLDAPYSLHFLQHLHETLAEHQACRLFFAVDQSTGALHSAALLAWDAQSAYYLVSGDDPALRVSGAAVLLKWEAILFAKNTLNLPVFDFEGSMIQTLERGRRDFGAMQRPYFRVEKEWSRVWKWRRKLKA
ncbi:MAG TPA: GNAT family N-acetyltransferase, partial [Saprospiraceae bacterium]|nr:GNAT family N-acetyltransferase [Saprospiraceae bacterium]